MFLQLSRKKICFYWLPVLIFVSYLIHYHSDRKVVSQPFDLPYVVVHLDFKGSPPKLSYLMSILGVLREHGANGLLLEYEDMFPFDEPLQHLSASNAYSRAELQEFVTKADEMGFVIIPLVQTFGHMQYVLEHEQHEALRENPKFTDSICPSQPKSKALIDDILTQLQEFVTKADEMGFVIIPLVQTFGHMQYVLEHEQHEALRENPKFTDSICPSQPKSKALIDDILTQIIHFHSKIIPLNFIHIGCDEVYTINSCQYCKQRNTTDIVIFRHHVQFVYNIIQRSSPGTEVLIWDDMLRGKKEELLNPMQLPIDLVSWHYHINVSVSYIDLYKYRKNFNSVWAASAFKGADGRESLMPKLVNRIWNHFSWMQFLEKYSRLVGQPKPDFRGIILTGWSRYNHNAPVCDILPASLPSLIINLLLIKKFNTMVLDNVRSMTWSNFYEAQLKEDVSKALMCDIAKKGINYIDGYECLFQGNDLNAALKSFSGFQRRLNNHKGNIDKISQRNLVENSEVKKNIDILMKETDDMEMTRDEMEILLREAMTQYFDNYVTESYLNQILAPTRTILYNARHKILAMNNTYTET